MTRTPEACPVCGGELVSTRLSCHTCGTHVVGEFGGCRYCSLDEADGELLSVFLASRGNLKEIEKHLGVSYPTARSRFAALLHKLGLAGESEDGGTLTQEQVLREVAAGALAPGEAAELLAAM
ncbi:MAG: DUF2089 domain-containing protein [Propionibacteriaceae bacterium]|jgi:hypothetical protein|nr:DUF2089 domain-containing protein [Propionibacteriaceae bacterium]